MKIPVLQTSTIRLRAPEPEDIDIICRMENDPAVWEVSNILVPYSRYQVEQYVLSSQHDIYMEKQLRLMIDLKVAEGDYKTIGAVDLFDFEPRHQRAGVGILIIPGERKKGHAGEVIGMLIRYCFDVLNLHQIYCNISPDNLSSIHLFQKHGFVQSGIKKEWRLVDGAWTDEIMFQLIKP